MSYSLSWEVKNCSAVFTILIQLTAHEEGNAVRVTCYVNKVQQPH